MNSINLFTLMACTPRSYLMVNWFQPLSDHGRPPDPSDRSELSAAEKRDLIEQGKPLPERYRFLLFAIDPPFDAGADYSMDVLSHNETGPAACSRPSTSRRLLHRHRDRRRDLPQGAEPPPANRLPRHLGPRRGLLHRHDPRATHPPAGLAHNGLAQGRCENL